MSAEDIAQAVADIRAGRIHWTDVPEPFLKAIQLLVTASSMEVVDATAIRNQAVTKSHKIYDDFFLAPPFEHFAVGYNTPMDNTVIVTMHTREKTELPWEPEAKWEPAEPVDWDRVRWVTQAYLWVGGHHRGQRVPMMGPVHAWLWAIYEDGVPADVRWIVIVEGEGPDGTPPEQRWMLPGIVAMSAVNFLNCRNVQIVEPTRPRAERRRIAKLGVSVKTLNVYPVSRRTASDSSRVRGNQGVPLTHVRGTFHHYGPEWGKELLFGKIAGRFWVPSHARGERALGESRHRYVLHPESGVDAPDPGVV